MKKIFFYFLLLLSVCSVQSQELLPFVENFTKSNYFGDNQVWSVAQGSDNALYYANNHYFLRYNGVKWEKYTLPNKTILRSVFVDGDKVYTGSYNEFGYWKRISGKMVYTSLSRDKKLFTGASINEEIWKIFKHQNKIYFQSFNELFVYTDGKIVKTRIPFQISYCFVVNDSIYMASVNNGVYLFENKSFKKVTKWQGLENNIIHGIATNKGQIYIFTQKNGVFVEENGKLIPWNNSLNAILKKEIIITAKFIDDNRLAIGTAFKGLYIVDLKSNAHQNINRNNSLINNSVLCIGFDKENDLWLGLDNGISHIEINSPYTIFSDNTGVLGSVYTLAAIKNGYLLGSNHGVFKYQDKNLQLLPNSQGQVWDIHKNGTKYIIGHNDGTFIYENDVLKKVNTISGGWKFQESDYDNKYFQANYSGIILYNSPIDFTKYKIVDNLTKPIKNIAQNKPKELWAVDNYRSLYRITFNNLYEVERVENITHQNKIWNDYGVKIFDYKNEILFFIDNVWYNFNSISNKLEKNEIFNKNFADISEIIPVNNSNFIVLKDKLLYVIHQIGENYIWDLIPEKYYEGKIINQDTKVFRDGNQLLMNLDDGFFSFPLKNAKTKNQKIATEAFYQGKMIDGNTSIHYNQSVEVDIISEYYGYNRLGLFYKLNDTKTFFPVKSGNIVLNNLSSGSQSLKIYYNNGENFIQVADYQFNVDKPWYFSLVMILVYILIISGSFYLYYKWNKIRYLEKLKLKEEELKHQKQILQLELIAENKLKMQEYDKHILEMQIQSKASEVAGKSLSIAKQSEMIDTIQSILDNESDINQLKNKIKKSIKINSINKNEWQSFEKNLMQSHEDFVHKLTHNYPQLTSKDIKLCIYLKMNLSSKEIAPLMNISFRGVELHRYRLRKKLELNQDINLSKFMINL
ncbi:histidine kinase [Flavobacterium sp. AS60]|uniref:helix-turn-helix and ligand-binding sensor domain-containing protein n=1 Tax=Flavobacterium anseongense TaxID=2910677 RepID=UPI001F3F2BB8|nr:histidine kinase [Flavobacterium sp. AS60]MCF6128833.1 histidine kinase [Flavobacterium sp. AS60]